MVQEVYSFCYIGKKCMFNTLETWAPMWVNRSDLMLRNLLFLVSMTMPGINLAPHDTVWDRSIPLSFLSSEWSKGGLWNGNAQSLQAVDNPLALPTLLKLAESKISHISGTCSYLGVSSTYQSPSSTYLQESGTGGIQEGLVWLWAIMEMTVCYEALGRPCQIWPPHPPLPPPPTAFFTLPDWRRFSTKYSQDATASETKEENCTSVFCKSICHRQLHQCWSPPVFLRERQCWAPWKHVWCSCGAEKSTSAGRDRPLERTTVPPTAV